MNHKINTFSTDVLVIGSGAAGLRSAIEAFESGNSVLIVGKSSFGNAHTKLAAGGLNAALGVIEKKDNWLIHAEDTFKEGGKIGNTQMIKTLAKNAPKAILELAEFGVDFERTKKNEIMQKVYGAQTYPRTCYVGDYTGKAILAALIKKVKKLRIKQLEKIYVTSLLKKNQKVIGCFGLDFKKGNFVQINAKAVVLATGGYSRIYKNSTSRNGENVGFGNYLALQSGLPLVGMEMTQFHPTGMVEPKNVRGKLVTEAVRSEGAKLFNAKNYRFMKKYDAKRMELSARDIVARAIWMEVFNGRGTKNRGVWLDLTHKKRKQILKRLPQTFEQFKRLGKIDISKKRMEVAPSSHYSMGGVIINPSDCSTDLKGLFAAGEVVGGLHGGNRLGGNSLSETLVFGKIAGKTAAEFAKKNKLIKPTLKQISNAKKEIDSFFKIGSIKPQKVKSKLQEAMWLFAGVIRSEKTLRQGLSKVEECKENLKQMSVKKGLGKNSELVTALDTVGMVEIAETVLKSALMRKESRGAHYRTDYKKTQKNWQANLICQKKKGKLLLSKKMVLKSI